ncbi:hypothetical protein [Streptomyces chartreusis]|uniref:hypothetical protein n=1 Tax=Streptomyces chartreusis TaxID=1969 RepID=UPI0036CF1DA3
MGTERCRALRDSKRSAEHQPVLVYERIGWGWLAWPVPGDGTAPELPVQIGFLAPGATMRRRLVMCWLLRRPAHRIALTSGSRASLRLSATVVGALALVAAFYALGRGLRADLVLPAMLLAPLLTEHLPDWLDDRAVEHVRWVEGDAPCHYLQSLAALQTYLMEAAAGSDRYGLRRSAAQSDTAVRTTDVYLLFAHEPYYPGGGAREGNATVVAADCLLHPQVRQPDGARIHDRLTRGRRPGEIISLATLTHELGGGADWPYVGDWESHDLVQLVRAANCDALSLGLPEIVRALICTGPNNDVSTLETAAGQTHLRAEGTSRRPRRD